MKNVLVRFTVMVMCVAVLFFANSCGADSKTSNGGTSDELNVWLQSSTTQDASPMIIVYAFSITDQTRGRGALVLMCRPDTVREYSLSVQGGVERYGCSDDLLNLADELCILSYDNELYTMPTEITEIGETNIPGEVYQAVLDMYYYAYGEGWDGSTCHI